MKNFIFSTINIYISRFGNQLVSFLLIPLIANVLEAEELQLYLLGISFSAFSIVFFDFSSQAIAVKNVSKNIFSMRTEFINVTSIKVIFSVIYFILGLFALIWWENINYFLIALLCSLQGMKPTWFYQSVLKLGGPTLIELSMKSITLSCLLIFSDELNQLSNIYLVMIGVELIALFLLYRRIAKVLIKAITNQKQKYEKLLVNLREGVTPFLTRIYGAIYISLPLPVASLYFENSQISSLIVMDRSIRITNSLLSPLIMVIYPLLSKGVEVKKEYIYLLISIIGMGLSIAIYFGADWIAMNVFNTANLNPYSKLLSIIPCLTALSSCIGFLDLNLKGKYNALASFTFVSLISCISILFVSLVIGSSIGIVISILIPEVVLFLLLIIFYLSSHKGE